MQAFSDGTMRYYDNSLNIWTTINSSFNTNYPFIFATYPANDTLYWANGSEGVYKWKLSWSAGTRLRNKGGVVSTITGTLNFLEDSTIVTGTSGTIFLTELIPGDWIRKDSSEDWYEVETVNSDSILNLSSIYVETTGPGIDDQSEKAPLWGKEGRFVNIWKDRLYVAAGATYYDLLKEDGDSLLQESGYKILVS